MSVRADPATHPFESRPGTLGWWVSFWGHVQSWLHFQPQSWMSASVLSFAVAFVVTLLIPTRRAAS